MAHLVVHSRNIEKDVLTPMAHHLRTRCLIYSQAAMI
jgi:hypothetical protein